MAYVIFVFVPLVMLRSLYQIYLDASLITIVEDFERPNDQGRCFST